MGCVAYYVSQPFEVEAKHNFFYYKTKVQDMFKNMPTHLGHFEYVLYLYIALYIVK